MFLALIKLHKAASVVMQIFILMKRKTLEVATCINMSDAERLHETLSRTNSVRIISPSLSRTCPQQPGFKSGGLRHVRALQERVYHDRKFDSWSWRLCWSGAHCHGASLITASVNEDVVCNVWWIVIRITNILNPRFTNCRRPTVKSFLLQTFCWIYICSTVGLSLQINYQPGSDVAPSGILYFY